MIHIPALHTVFHHATLFQAIAPLYDIGTPVSSRFIANQLNDTYSVITERGPFILRIYKPNWRSESDIRHELDLLLHLHQRNIPVSIPIARLDGDLLTELDAPEGIRYAVLFTFAEGTGKVTVESSRLYGRSVAHMHLAAENYVPRYSRFNLDAHHLLAEPMQRILPFLQHRPDEARRLTDAAKRLQARLDSLPEDTSDWGVCHGDLHGWNVFYSGDNNLTHFDFDCCGMGWRAYDLAVFQWCRVDHRDPEKAGFQDECWDSFIQAYQEVRPLQEIDVELIPLFVAIRQVWLIGLHTGNSAIWGAWQDDAYFDRKLKFLHDWMTAHQL